MVGRVDTVVTSLGKQHVYVWQGFCYYEPGWSPIKELVAADVTYAPHQNEYLFIFINPT